MKINLYHQISDILSMDWDALGDISYPFTRYSFLNGLEKNDCLQPFGWHPVYFVAYEDDKLVAALPCFIKTNSYGELVFDHAWANAYQRSGIEYYPKLVSAIPYTPATGNRFLLNKEFVKDSAHQQQIIFQLCSAVQSFCDENQMSSWHVLFEHQAVIESLETVNLLSRCDIQFHWQNQGYATFDDFLSNLSSRKRKNIRKERKKADAHGLVIQMEQAEALNEDDWHQVSNLYASIYHRKYGTPTLTEAFFNYIGKHFQQHVLVTTARSTEGKIIACSLFFKSDTHLYGRVWGCEQFYDDLHFECCYYQGIEYCIEHGLQCFDPGAQGEHKLSRGFLPTKTWSAHWFKHEEFQSAVANFLEQEKRHINLYQKDLDEHSPYRKTD